MFLDLLFRDYFVIDLSDFPNEHEESTDGADTGEETATMLDPEADCTVYNDKTIAASEETLQSILEKVYKKNQKKNRRELDYSKAPKFGHCGQRKRTDS